MMPSVKSVISPALLLPAMRSMLKNGSGVSRTIRSSTMLLAEWPTNMAKNSSGTLLPHPIHVPSRLVFQSLSIGVQGKTASKKKARPHMELKTMRTQVVRTARRYCALVVVLAVSAKRRRY